MAKLMIYKVIDKRTEVKGTYPELPCEPVKLAIDPKCLTPPPARGGRCVYTPINTD
nr:hypothetical protein [Candidatus Cloacimonadota bacterium]